uniref:helix-turn-helix transcriptional regulator n=1 Tax=Streptococcus alactolyticus TaxID=29389 RepID=UPI003753464D
DKSAKHLTEKEIFAICKILIESRAFNKEEFNKIVDKLLILCQGEERRGVKDAINNERFHYLELQHGKALIDDIWKLRQTITNQQIIEIDYQRADKKIKQHKVKPVGIVFSKFYFYLLAFPMDVTIEYPIIFRVDRIETIKITSGTFTIDPRGYDEAGFKKRTPFMYSGELQTIRFEFTGILEALLDRLPTVRIEKETEKGVIARAEAFGKEGIEMWLKSQGDRARILEKEE